MATAGPYEIGTFFDVKLLRVTHTNVITDGQALEYLRPLQDPVLQDYHLVVDLHGVRRCSLELLRKLSEQAAVRRDNRKRTLVCNLTDEGRHLLQLLDQQGAVGVHRSPADAFAALGLGAGETSPGLWHRMKALFGGRSSHPISA